MANDVGNNPATAADPAFSGSEYFLGIAERIASRSENTRIVLPGKGEVTVYPDTKEFFADIPDMAEFFQAPAAQFQVSALSAAPLAPKKPGTGKNISELLWEAGFHASQGRLVTGTTKFDVVQFRAWPNLTRLPKTPNTARICALLTRHATTINLVHRQLGIDSKEVYQVYSAAYSAGLARIRNLESTTMLHTYGSTPADNEVVESNMPEQKRSLLGSLFSKISGL